MKLFIAIDLIVFLFVISYYLISAYSAGQSNIGLDYHNKIYLFMYVLGYRSYLKKTLPKEMDPQIMDQFSVKSIIKSITKK